MSDDKDNSESYPELPDGSQFQTGSLLEHPKGLLFIVQGMIAIEDDLMVLMEPQTPDVEDPGTPQGDVLSAMMGWKVVRFEPENNET